MSYNLRKRNINKQDQFFNDKKKKIDFEDGDSSFEKISSVDENIEQSSDVEIIKSTETSHVSEVEYPISNINKRIEKVIDSIMDKHGLIIDDNDSDHEYSEKVPKDLLWKEKMDKDKVERLEPILKDIRKILEEEEPTMEKILNLVDQKKISKFDAGSLVQLFDIYNNYNPYTEEKLEIRNILCKKISDYQRIQPNQNLDEMLYKEYELMKNIPPIDIFSLKSRILSLEANDVIKARLLDMYKKLLSYGKESSSYNDIKEKLLMALDLPYNKKGYTRPLLSSEDINSYCSHVRETLDAELYGMDKVKDELICILNNKISNPDTKCSIGLKGARGTGKTSIVAALAKAINKPFQRIALAGLDDPTPFKGSDTHWSGSRPSSILRIMKEMKISDGIIFLDEIDKIGDKVQDALLHVTDYSQNHEFTDMFLDDFTHDISKIWFIYAMNDDNLINPILRDRLHIIEVDSYSKTEIKHIIKNYVFPKELKNLNISPSEVSIDESGCSALLDFCEDVNGVRTIQKSVATILSRINLYKTNCLPDGSLGKLKMDFTIPNFKLPLCVDRSLITSIMPKPKKEILSYFS